MSVQTEDVWSHGEFLHGFSAEEFALIRMFHSGTILNCGIHTCPSHCHQLHDHSKMRCENVMESKCTKGHISRWKCSSNRPQICQTCNREQKLKEKEQEANLERQRKRDLEIAKHNAVMEALNEEIRQVREDQLEEKLAKERVQALEQKKKDLEAARRSAAYRSKDSKQQTDQEPPHSQSNSVQVPLSNKSEVKSEQKHNSESPSESEWKKQKRSENAKNDILDELMDMTGLEHVKGQFLTLKSKVETVQRQGTDLKNERFGSVLLGNPGTGMNFPW